MRSLVFTTLAVGMLTVACAPKSPPTSTPTAPNPPAAAPAATPAPAPPAAAAPAPAAPTPRRSCHATGCGARGRSRRPRRPWKSSASATTAAECDARAGEADRVGGNPQPRPARRAGGGTLGCGAGGLEHPARVDHTADREVPRRHQFGPRVHREVHRPGQLQRVPGVRRVEPREADAGDDLRVPGVAE